MIWETELLFWMVIFVYLNETQLPEDIFVFYC